ncbi:protein of unknown function [Lutibacter oricola]|uniref:DUF4369 domain-containing protein n=1 Tax=Lutibacter oricola TaxID=762486 RepID=A0A1H3ANP9_9FLAO|nr:DUF4369 domain-containing protein [Lutibacter oricola]SDX31317.1 protein of unknown function [Lutibacter oricola]
MKYAVIYCLLILSIVSCKKPTDKINNSTAKNLLSSFEISGSLKNFSTRKIYLNKIIESSLYPIDSAFVKDNSFTFKGVVQYPERFALTYENYATTSIIIVENKNFQLQINGLHLSEPLIADSPLNDELNAYKTSSKRIFSKINELFPQFQKARLENDSEKLKEIGSEMKTIETEFTNFTYNYIKTNKNSFLAAMLLKDQLKTSTVDTLKIKSTYKLLSSEVKKCPDAIAIATTLNLH